MEIAELNSLQSTVLWAAFAVSLAFGFIAQRTHFCTMGAISDIVNMGSWVRMRMWGMAVGVAMLGFHFMAWFGWIDPSKTIYASGRIIWLSALTGGALFGFGMVLASGCGSKTLVRIGGGSLKSLVVFLVMGLAAYMTLRGLFGVWRAAFLDPVAVQFAPSQDLPTLLGAGDTDTVRTLRLAIGGGIGLALVAFALASREFRSFDNLLGGFGVGLAVTGAWYVSGHLGFVAEDPRTLEEAFVATNSGRLEALSFVAPVAYTLELLMFWSDTSRIVTVGIASVLGVIAGSLAWALLSRGFRWEGFAGPEDTANHLVGGALMGIGGVTALGCTIGQGLSGLSTLAIGSFIAFAAILAGGLAGLRYLGWRVERMI